MDSGMRAVMEFNGTYDGILISISSSAIVYLSAVPYTSSSLGQSWDIPKVSINITVPMVNNNLPALQPLISLCALPAISSRNPMVNITSPAISAP